MPKRRKQVPVDDLVFRKARKPRYRVVADEAERILEDRSSSYRIQKRPFKPSSRRGKGNPRA